MSRPATPSSTRRSSISSVTSSGRRKDQSLLDVAASLGQRTPERSEPPDEGISTRSRQLDFGSVDGGDVDAENDEVDAEPVEQNGDAPMEVEDREVEEEPSPVRLPRRGRGRRKRIFWTTAEVEFLRQGVEKYGVGNWRKILIDGQTVFLSHRTNVDLKDKWKHLSKNPNPKRPRSHSSNSPEQDVSAKRSKPPSNTSEISSPESEVPRRRRAVVQVDTPVADDGEGVEVAVANDEEDEAVGDSTRSIKMRFATDKQPEFVEVDVDLHTYKNASALIEHLRSSILVDASPDTQIQIIGLKNRVLLDDEDDLSRCVQQNGADFFLVFEENPEEFV